MPYSEQDFLNGLAAGLTATASQNAFPVSWQAKYYIHLDKPCAVFCCTFGTSGKTWYDWGDGSERRAESLVRRNYGKTRPSLRFNVYETWGAMHEYASAGDYVITVSGNSPRAHVYWACSQYVAGSYDYDIRMEKLAVFALSGDFSQQNTPTTPELESAILQKAHFRGINATIQFESYCFGHCYGLKSIMFSGSGKIEMTDYAFRDSQAWAHPVACPITDIYLNMTEYDYNHNAKIRLNMSNVTIHFKSD